MRTKRAYIRMERPGKVEIILTINLKSASIAGMLSEIQAAITDFDVDGMRVDSISFCEVE